MRAWAPLLILAVASPLRAAQDGFGRWQQDVSQCLLQLGARRMDRCQGLRLDQRNEAVLRLSVLGPAEEPGLMQELTFVGELDPGSAPMRCSDGVCQLEAPMRLLVAVVRTARFNSRGLAVGYPSTTPASGQCALSKSEVSCRAESSTGEQWSAQLTLR